MMRNAVGLGKWSLAALAAIVVAGCGGSGSKGGGTIVTPTGRTVPVITLGAEASVQPVFLSGAQRSFEIGSQVAVIDFVEFTNESGAVVPSPDRVNFTPMFVNLSGYTINSRSFSVAFAANESSQRFTEFPLQIASIREVTDIDGNTILRYDQRTSAPNPFDINLRVFPGRYSSIQVRLDDLVVSYDDIAGIQFDEDRFTEINYNPKLSPPRMTSFLSDYVAFDISGLTAAQRPTLSTSEDADRVLFSGDRIALSNGVGADSLLEVLDTDGTTFTGTLNPASTIQGTSTLPTYTLEAEDPSFSTIVSLLGVWRDSSRVITTTDTITAVSFPNSAESDTPQTDGDRQQFLIYQTNGGVITSMWQGEVTFGDPDNGGGDTTKGTFLIYPISTLDDAIPTGEVRGTVSNLVYVNGTVRRGDWDIIGTVPANFPLPRLGGFGVFRR